MEKFFAMALRGGLSFLLGLLFGIAGLFIVHFVFFNFPFFRVTPQTAQAVSARGTGRRSGCANELPGRAARPRNALANLCARELRRLRSRVPACLLGAWSGGNRGSARADSPAKPKTAPIRHRWRPVRRGRRADGAFAQAGAEVPAQDRVSRGVRNSILFIAVAIWHR